MEDFAGRWIRTRRGVFSPAARVLSAQDFLHDKSLPNSLSVSAPPATPSVSLTSQAHQKTACVNNAAAGR